MTAAEIPHPSSCGGLPHMFYGIPPVIIADRGAQVMDKKFVPYVGQVKSHGHVFPTQTKPVQSRSRALPAGSALKRSDLEPLPFWHRPYRFSEAIAIRISDLHLHPYFETEAINIVKRQGCGTCHSGRRAQPAPAGRMIQNAASKPLTAMPCSHSPCHLTDSSPSAPASGPQARPSHTVSLTANCTYPAYLPAN